MHPVPPSKNANKYLCEKPKPKQIKQCSELLWFWGFFLFWDFFAQVNVCCTFTKEPRLFCTCCGKISYSDVDSFSDKKSLNNRLNNYFAVLDML